MMKTTVVTLRLNPRDPREKRALEILEERRSQGYGARETVTDALLSRAGDRPEMYRTIDGPLSAGVMQGIVEETVGGLLEQFAQYLVQQVLSDVQSGKIAPSAERPFGEQEQTDYEANLVRGVLNRRRQS